MRIRTDGDYSHRADVIEAAAERLDVNKTRAVVVSCDAIGELLDNVEEALENPGLSQELRQDLAETISTHEIGVEVSAPSTTVETKQES